MKISRYWSVIIVVTIIAALMVGSLGTWFSSVFTFIGIYIGFGLIAEVCKQTVSKETQKKAGQIRSKMLGIETLGMLNLSEKSLNEVAKVWANIPTNQHAGFKERELAFGKQINAVTPTTNTLPDSMLFLVARKALYEIQRKRGNLKFHKLGQKPFATSEEIMRPLGNDEVQMFHSFCDDDTTMTVIDKTRAGHEDISAPRSPGHGQADLLFSVAGDQPSKTTPAKVNDYFKSLVAESPRWGFIATVIVGTFLVFLPFGPFLTIFLGHLAWSDLEITPRSASLRKPWLIGVLALGYLIGLPLAIMTIMDPAALPHLIILRLWDGFLVFNDNHPVLVPCIVGAFLIFLISPFLISIVRLIIGTAAIESKLEATRASMEKGTKVLQDQNKEILVKLDDMSRELARVKTNAEASSNSGANRLIIP